MKTVKDLMTSDPVCCSPDTPLQEVAQMMLEHACGCIPIIESNGSQHIAGVLTDRDICCRTVAQGRNPLDLTARDVMTSPAVTVSPKTSIEQCCQLMEDNLIRRIPVLDESGRCCGIVAQADIALNVERNLAADVLRHVSQPTEIESCPAAGQPVFHH
jgi:CBS domain-containing protein